MSPGLARLNPSWIDDLRLQFNRRSSVPPQLSRAPFADITMCRALVKNVRDWAFLELCGMFCSASKLLHGCKFWAEDSQKSPLLDPPPYRGMKWSGGEHFISGGWGSVNSSTSSGLTTSTRILAMEQPPPLLGAYISSGFTTSTAECQTNEVDLHQCESRLSHWMPCLTTPLRAYIIVGYHLHNECLRQQSTITDPSPDMTTLRRGAC